MKAIVYASAIAIVFILAGSLASYLIYYGYGIPSSYTAVYFLRRFNIEIGLGKQLGKPVIYDWDIVVLLRPGKTSISIMITEGLTQELIRNTGCILIRLYIDGRVYSSRNTSMNVTVERNNVFFVSRVQVIFYPNITVSIPISPTVHITINSYNK